MSAGLGPSSGISFERSAPVRGAMLCSSCPFLPIFLRSRSTCWMARSRFFEERAASASIEAPAEPLFCIGALPFDWLLPRVSSRRSPSLLTAPVVLLKIPGTTTEPAVPTLLFVSVLLPFELDEPLVVAPLALEEPMGELAAELLVLDPEREPFALPELAFAEVALPFAVVLRFAVFAAELSVLFPERLPSTPPELFVNPLLMVVLVVPSALVVVVVVKLPFVVLDVIAWLAVPLVRLTPTWGAPVVCAPDVATDVPAGRAAVCAKAEPATAMTTVVTTYAGDSLRIVISLVNLLKSKEITVQYTCPSG